MAASRFRIVPARSRFWADAKSTLHPVHAETSALDGYLDVEMIGNRLSTGVGTCGHVEFDVERMKSGNALFDTELLRRIEVRKFPRVKVDTREIRDGDGTGEYRVRGDLAFHGVTRTIEGDVTVRILGDTTLQIDGTKELDMRDFGLEPPIYVEPLFRIGIRIVVERPR
jgi:polyisoprenoid-binding protein YceI